MKKIFYFVTALLVLGFAATSCDDAPDNPGDFSVASEFSLTSVYSLHSNQPFDFKVVSERDTVYMYRHITTDTLKDIDGNYIIDDKGNYTTTKDTTYMPGDGPHARGRVIEIEPIIKTWTADDAGTADTLRLQVKSNARWKLLKATVLNTALQDYSTTNDSRRYYANCNATDKGGGDGHIDIEMQYYSGNRVYVLQPVMTNDSAVLYLIRMQIRGKNYK